MASFTFPGYPAIRIGRMTATGAGSLGSSMSSSSSRSTFKSAGASIPTRTLSPDTLTIVTVIAVSYTHLTLPTKRIV